MAERQYGIVTVAQLHAAGLDASAIKNRCSNLHSRDVKVHKRIPVTTIPRLLVDLTDEVTKWELANVIHEAAFRDRFDLGATRSRAVARTDAAASSTSTRPSRCTSPVARCTQPGAS